MAFVAICPTRHPLVPLQGLASRGGRIHSCCGLSGCFLDFRLLTLRFSARRFHPTLGVCYRAPWCLPGPDSHRLVNTSLHEIAFSLAITPFQASRSLGTPASC